MGETKLPHFDTCIVLRNPRSTRAETVARRIAALQKLFPADAFTVLNMVPHDDTANRDLLYAAADRLGAQTLLAVAGGDGTVNFATEALLSDPRFSSEQRQATVLPLWGGNANDLAVMLNGFGRSAVKHILTTGKRVAVYPLCCDITTLGVTRTYTAICYASFGASAVAAAALEAQRDTRITFHTRARKFIHELSIISTALRQALPFTVEEKNAPRTIYDRIFINGSRWAGVGAIPQRITDKQFLHITVEQKRIASLAFHITELLRKRPENYIVKAPETVQFTLHESTWAQIDGEVMELLSGTHIRIALSDQPFYALSTLL